MDNYIKYGIIVGIAIGVVMVLAVSYVDKIIKQDEVENIILKMRIGAERCLFNYPTPEYVVEQGECIRKVTERYAPKEFLSALNDDLERQQAQSTYEQTRAIEDQKKCEDRNKRGFADLTAMCIDSFYGDLQAIDECKNRFSYVYVIECYP
ncbi:MAG: hypothetical protein IIB80_08655 [Thaumarchaeota archaeon]|nr:hypothetical protein [Nitrososphaerota archaeon]